MIDPFKSPVNEGNREWWEKRFASHEGYLYGKAPSNFLVEHLNFLRKGETLDVGMGEGRNAVYLSQKGFTVTGVDWSESAVARAKTLASETGVPLEAKVVDLSFFVMPLMKYDAIVVSDFRPPLTLFKGLVRGLKQGGTLLMEGYALEQLRIDGGARPEAFECFRPNEALEFVRELHLILYNERQVGPKEARVQLIARKPSR